MLTVELTDVLKAAPTASSLSGLSIQCVDSSGNLSKVAPLKMNEAQMQVTGNYIMDLNEATTAGVYALNGSGNPLNGPDGINLTAGMLEVFYRGGSTGLLYQRIISNAGAMASRTRYSGTWRPWIIHQ